MGEEVGSIRSSRCVLTSMSIVALSRWMGMNRDHGDRGGLRSEAFESSGIFTDAQLGTSNRCMRRGWPWSIILCLLFPLGGWNSLSQESLLMTKAVARLLEGVSIASTVTW